MSIVKIQDTDILKTIKYLESIRGYLLKKNLFKKINYYNELDSHCILIPPSNCFSDNEIFEDNPDQLNHNTYTTPLIQTDIYEGGQDLWECSIDLLHFIYKKHSIHRSEQTLSSFKTTILELGCGLGIPGLSYLLPDPLSCENHYKINASYVVFQDLNETVLITTTIPTVFFTLRQFFSFEDTQEILLNHCCFIYGNWDSMQKLDSDSTICHLGTHFFDYILSSEGLYRVSNFPAIEKIIIMNLKKTEHALALFGTKRYYFGIGGGTYQFIDYIHHRQVNKVKQSSNRPVDSEDIEKLLFGDPIQTKLQILNPMIETSICGESTLLDTASEDVVHSQTTQFSIHIIATVDNGLSNIRDILEMSWLLETL